MDALSAQATVAGTSGNPTPPKAGSERTLSSDFETFLQMLTAQAKYQDPMEPIDSSEYSAQLAQFSSVEQQVQTNELLTAMMTQMSSANMAQFAGWIGMEARSEAAGYFDGSVLTIVPKPAAGAEETRLTVFDAAGKEVQTQIIPVSNEPIQWKGLSSDGTVLPKGLYSFQLENLSQGKAFETSAVASYSKITEARNEAGQTVLILEGGETVSAADITALREPS